MNVIEWLLDSDPSIRWQVMRDLTDATTDQVAAQRARVATDGWGAQLLSMQGSDGVWRIEGEQPDMVTVRIVSLLGELGLDPASVQARAAIDRLRGSPTWLTMLPEGYAFHGRPFFSGETEPCINGRIVAAGAYFGEDVSGIVERLLGEQMADGGWNCEQENGSVRGSFDSTINVLEGLLLFERSVGGAGIARVAEARRKGEEYLLERHLFRRLSTGETADPEFTRFSFPTGYHYDVLRALDYFRFVGGAPDERLGEAIDIVAGKRRDDGTWELEAFYLDDAGHSFGEVVGQPSRWITLRALRVLGWIS